jgi:hypothetical protein
MALNLRTVNIMVKISQPVCLHEKTVNRNDSTCIDGVEENFKKMAKKVTSK